MKKAIIGKRYNYKPKYNNSLYKDCIFPFAYHKISIFTCKRHLFYEGRYMYRSVNFIYYKIKKIL